MEFTGRLQTSNCDVDAKDQKPNAGCSIVAPAHANTSGLAFNDNGGGVFALEWTAGFLSVYFFPRGAIPAGLLQRGGASHSAVLSSGGDSANSTTAPDPSGWAAANRIAYFEGCEFDAHLSNLSLVVDMDFCGGWVESQWENGGCMASTGKDSCADFVAAGSEGVDGKGFEEAFWVIGGMEVWQDD